VPISQFSDLPLDERIVKALDSQNIRQLTPVQRDSLPLLLAGRDIIAQAQTGSGKTLAFGAALLQYIKPAQRVPQALVLCPTRELAQQVAESLRKAAVLIENLKILTLCGGQPIGPQLRSLEHGCDIVVGTPGRISDLVGKESLPLHRVHTVVLDEADRMLDMGFIDVISELLDECAQREHTWLFSATFPKGIESISSRFQHNAERVSSEPVVTKNTIEHTYYDCSKLDPNEAAISILSELEPTTAIVFCNTIANVKQFSRELYESGFICLALHGDLEQKQRDENIVRFSNLSTQILVATDVAARGLDIDDVDLVLNYELARDRATHTHRIGRTGRAGKKGVAVTLLGASYLVDKVLANDDSARIVPFPNDFIQAAKPKEPEYVTVAIAGGKKNKVRKGDILGALTGDGGLRGDQIGTIQILNFQSYIAIARPAAAKAISFLQTGKIKGRFYKSRRF
jgi:ATP-independent RNA helicase DbpA